VGSTFGRALNRFGEFFLAPFENSIIRRELEGLIQILDRLDSTADWSKVRTMMSNFTVVDRVIEPLRWV
jgi:hypothetical protein